MATSLPTAAPRAAAGAHPVHVSLIVRVPHQAAFEAASAVLDDYPLTLLRRAAARSVRVWLLERGEPVSSAALLDAAARARRWHGGTIGLEDCAGLTVPVADSVVVVAPWHRPAVLRHELGHALSLLFSASQRRRLEALYRIACAERRLVAALARATIGEYAACGLAHFARLEDRRRLAELDPALAALLGELWDGRQVSGATARSRRPLALLAALRGMFKGGQAA